MGGDVFTFVSAHTAVFLQLFSCDFRRRENLPVLFQPDLDVARIVLYNLHN